MSTMSRRQLVGGAGIGFTAIAIGATAAPAFASEAAGEQSAWDAEYDVVVLGFGAAGANSSVAAYEEGAKVLLCEKAPDGQEPCNSKASGQLIMATDDAEGLYTYFEALCGNYDNWDEEAMRAYCEECLLNFDWLTNTLGADPNLVYPTENPAENPDSTEYGNPDWQPFDDLWGIGRPGYMHVWDEFPEIPESCHAMSLMTNGEAFNSEYYNLCKKAIESRIDNDRLTVWKAAPGKRLITDATGAVVGVVIEKDGEELRVKANGGVILATGGFEANPDMISSYTQLPYAYLQAGTMNTGNGIKMAQAVGAELWHMSNVSGWMWAYKNPNLTTCTTLSLGFSPAGIYVGPSGKRFQNETAENRHGRIDIGGSWISTPCPLPAYYITDSAHIGEPLIPGFSADNTSEIEAGIVIVGETIEELSENIRTIGEAPSFNINGELDSALAKYNAHCHANNNEGEEDDWGRMCTIPVETTPFYAVKIGPTMYNTQGGPRRNKFGQIVSVDGLPIQGLFSAGELGSVFPDMYNGGGNLGETMVFGRISGTNAAKRARGEFEGASEPTLTKNQRLAIENEQATAGDAIAFESLADGTYEGRGSGFGGAIVLSITVEAGAVSSCEIVESAETPAYGGTALPVYCEQLVETQDLNSIDVASSASNTLRGFKEAVNDALA